MSTTVGMADIRIGEIARTVRRSSRLIAKTRNDWSRGIGSSRDGRGSGRDGRGSGRDGRGSGRDGRGSGRDGRGSGRDGRGSGTSATKPVESSLPPTLYLLPPRTSCGWSTSATSSEDVRELSLQTLPAEVMSLILRLVGEDELWRLRNLCRAFKSAYESSVRLKLYRLLPHIKSLMTAVGQAVENSMFSAEQLRMSQARKMLLLRFAHREALMFVAMVWRHSSEPAAWSAICHPASQVLDEFYTLANGASVWARVLDFTALHSRLRAWNAFQLTYTTRIEPVLAKKPVSSVVPLSIQVLDILDCALFSNWESSLELRPRKVGGRGGGRGGRGRQTASLRKTPTTPTVAEATFDLDYWMRVRLDGRRGGVPGGVLSTLVARSDGSAAAQSAVILRFLRRAVSESNVAELSRILDDLEPLELSVARSWGFQIPDQMVEDMSRIYARVFQEYPQPWPLLGQSEDGLEQRLTRRLDYEVAQSTAEVRLTLSGVPRNKLPLSWTQDSLKELVNLTPPPPSAALSGKQRRGASTGASLRPRPRRRRRADVLSIEMTRPERRNRVLKSSVTVRGCGVNKVFRLTKATRYFRLR